MMGSAATARGRGHVGRNGLQLERAAVWSDPGPTADNAEALKNVARTAEGRRHRAAPVLVCIGRERVILKEIRYTAVPAHEEPAGRPLPGDERSSPIRRTMW